MPHLELRGGDRAAFAALRAMFACNRRVMRLLSAYLNEMPTLVTPQALQELQESCGVTAEEAFCAMMGAASGLEDAREEDRRLMRDYLPAVFHRADPAIYRSDPYYQHIRVPAARYADWSFGEQTYQPGEGFVCGPLRRAADGREWPQIAFFEEPFSFPTVYQGGVEWMAIKPNEIETMRAPLQQMQGHVVAFGLGMGYFAYMAAQRPTVSAVTVVERDPAVLHLFRTFLLPQFPCRDKITLVEADAFDFAARQLPALHATCAFVDLWHDALDGLPLYIRMRQQEAASPDTTFFYWIEDMLLSRLRDQVFATLESACDAPVAADNGHTVHGMDEVRQMLSDRYLRELTLSLRPVLS